MAGTSGSKRDQRGRQEPEGGLERLPRLEHFVLVGTIHALDRRIKEGGRMRRPAVVLWMDAEATTVRASRVVIPELSADEGIGEAIEVMREALEHPAPLSGQPGLPELARVTDEELATAARRMLAPLGIAVEVVPDLPLMDAALESLESYLEREAAASEPFRWTMDPELLRPLFEAAGRLAQIAPWDFLEDYPPVAVHLGSAAPNKSTPVFYGCVLGAGGMVQGIAFYYSWAAVGRAVETGLELAEMEAVDEEGVDNLIDALRQSGLPVDEVPEDLLRDAIHQITEGGALPEMENAILVTFDREDEIDPSYLEWLVKRQLPVVSLDAIPMFYRTRRNDEPRLLNKREVQAARVALVGVNAFLGSLGEEISAIEEPEELAEPILADVEFQDGSTVEVWWPGDMVRLSSEEPE